MTTTQDTATMFQRNAVRQLEIENLISDLSKTKTPENTATITKLQIEMADINNWFRRTAIY